MKQDDRAATGVVPPSEVNLHPTGTRVRIGGRLRSENDGEWIVADAFAAIRVRLASRADASPGDLVVLEGISAKHGLSRAHLVERHAHRRPPSDGEHARLVDRGVGPRLLARAGAMRAVRGYFESDRFIEIDTPVRVPCPGLDAHVDAVPAQEGYLVTSPELHMKRLLVGGVPRLFQFARASRAKELGPQHEPEFCLLEWYRAFSGVEAVMADTEILVTRVAEATVGRPEVRIGNAVSRLTPPFPRLTVREAFHEFAATADAVDLAASDEDRFFQLFVDTVEPGLRRSLHPVFLTEFPLTQGALAKATPYDPRVVERFELFVGGVELCNGYGELTDPIEQRSRFDAERARRLAAGAPVYPIDERFMAALDEGLPPSGGNALGFDRLLALVLGVDCVADVMAFPASRL